MPSRFQFLGQLRYVSIVSLSAFVHRICGIRARFGTTQLVLIVSDYAMRVENV